MSRRSSLAAVAALAMGALCAAAVILAAGPAYAAPPAAALAYPQGQGQAGAPGLNNWQELAPGQTVEWLFQYNGNDDSALIALGADPAGSIGVKVYDEGQWRHLTAGDTSVQPAGRGTPGTLNPWLTNQDLISNGKLFWEAKAHPAIKFHIQVSNLIQDPALYWIAAAGPGAGSLTLVTPGPAVNPALTAQAAPAGSAPAALAPPSAAPARPLRPPPRILPPTGAEPLPPLGAAGLALIAAGLWARRPPKARAGQLDLESIFTTGMAYLLQSR